MQTFLPVPSFTESAAMLDRQRLGKQRVETMQILRALTGLTKGWVHHPAVKMWRGYESCLADYGAAMCHEWIKRGYKDTCLAHFLRQPGQAPTPPWLGNTDFHRSHQSNLVRKLAEHYGPLFPGVPDDLPYVWPAPVAVVGVR